ncbi:acetyltransferase [[Bacillus] sp. KCTC 13219]|nr:acetyltransferase [[Bacillus] sp. KCTC 13219]
MIPTLETERLILREISLKDAESIFAYFSNDDMTKHYGMQSFTNIGQAERLIEAFATNFQNKRGMRWGITIKGNHRLIGTIGFNLWSPVHKRAEVGFEIHPDFWRAGYASEGLQKIVEYGFRELGFTRIGAIVFVENEASNQLLTKQGFEKEGLLRNYMYQNGQPYYVNVYSKLTI